MLKLRNLYLLNAVLALLFAIGLLLITTTMLSMFNIDNSPDTRMLAQLLGVELVISGLLTLLARDVADPNALSAINFSHMVSHALGFIITLNGTYTGVMSGTGWVAVIIFAVLGLGFAYFQFFKPMD